MVLFDGYGYLGLVSESDFFKVVLRFFGRVGILMIIGI